MRRLIHMASAAAFALAAVPADAGNPIDRAIKFRQRLMSSVSAAVLGLGNVARGTEDMSPVVAELDLLLLAATNYELTSAAFALDTDGQGERDTSATAKVWEDQEGFRAGLRKLAEQAAAIAALGADVSWDELDEINDTCKSCHDDYREQ